jgi:hypothetical protein
MELIFLSKKKNYNSKTVYTILVRREAYLELLFTDGDAHAIQ